MRTYVKTDDNAYSVLNPEHMLDKPVNTNIDID